MISRPIQQRSNDPMVHTFAAAAVRQVAQTGHLWMMRVDGLAAALNAYAIVTLRGNSGQTLVRVIVHSATARPAEPGITIYPDADLEMADIEVQMVGYGAISVQLVWR